MLQLSRELAYAAFESAALGSTVFAVGLVAAIIAYGIWTVAKGLNHAANFLAWTSAVAIWAVGLASSRGVFITVTVFRYRYAALVLILLAVVPRRPIVWAALVPVGRIRRWALRQQGSSSYSAARGAWPSAATSNSTRRSLQQGRERAKAQENRIAPNVTGDTPLGFDYGNLSFLFGGLSPPMCEPCSPATANPSRRPRQPRIVGSSTSGAWGHTSSALSRHAVHATESAARLSADERLVPPAVVGEQFVQRRRPSVR